MDVTPATADHKPAHLVEELSSATCHARETETSVRLSAASLWLCNTGRSATIFSMDDTAVTMISVGGTLLGVLLGGLLSARVATRQHRREQAAQLVRDLSEFSELFWSATKRDMLQALDRLDGQMALAGAREYHRSGFRFAALKCWEDRHSREAEGDPEAGVSTKLLDAYEQVRSALLSELLATGWWKRRNRRAATTEAVKDACEAMRHRESS